MSALYALPRDVIQVRQPIPIQDGVLDELTPGFYVILGQLGKRLALARAGEGEDGNMVAIGRPLTVSIEWLETEAISITYLKAMRWIRTYSAL